MYAARYSRSGRNVSEQTGTDCLCETMAATVSNRPPENGDERVMKTDENAPDSK